MTVKSQNSPRMEGCDFCLWKRPLSPYSPLSPGGAIPPPGGGQLLLFYGKLQANLSIFVKHGRDKCAPSGELCNKL